MLSTLGLLDLPSIHAINALKTYLAACINGISLGSISLNHGGGVGSIGCHRLDRDVGLRGFAGIGRLAHRVERGQQANAAGLGFDVKNHILFAFCGGDKKTAVILNSDTGKIITSLPIGYWAAWSLGM